MDLGLSAVYLGTVCGDRSAADLGTLSDFMELAPPPAYPARQRYERRH